MLYCYTVIPANVTYDGGFVNKRAELDMGHSTYEQVDADTAEEGNYSMLAEAESTFSNTYDYASASHMYSEVKKSRKPTVQVIQFVGVFVKVYCFWYQSYLTYVPFT